MRGEGGGGIATSLAFIQPTASISLNFIPSFCQPSGYPAKGAVPNGNKVQRQKYRRFFRETAGFASGNGHEPVQVKEAASEDTIWSQIIGRCGACSCVAVVVILPDHYRFSSGFSRFREEEYSVDKSCVGG